MTRCSLALPAALLAALALAHAGADAGPNAGTPDPGLFAVRASRIYTLAGSGGSAGLLEGGALLIRAGKIVAAGAAVEIPAGVKVIEFRDAVIIPGLVDAGGRVAGEVPGEETVSAKYCAVDAFDPFSRNQEVLAAGITTTYLAPSSRRLVSGRGAVVKTAGADRDERILSGARDLCVNLCESAYGPGGLQEFPLPAWSFEKIEPAAPQKPGSRMGQILALHEAFAAAAAYSASRKAAGERVGDARPAYDHNLEVLSEVLAEHPILRIRALRSVDIEAGLAFAAELKHKAYLCGCTEAHRIAKELGASGLGVVLEVPWATDRPAAEAGIWPGRIEERLETAALLAEAGVPVALTAAGEPRRPGLLPAAQAAVRGGLAESAALAAVTIAPAELLGVSRRVGSLEPGKDADFVVLSAAPFDAAAHVREVYVDGRSVFERAAAGQGAVVVRAGTVFTACGAPIEDGAVLMENGKIVAVGRTVPIPPGARVVDAGPDAVVTPGLIDGHGHLGLEGDQGAPGPNVAIAKAVAVSQDNFGLVARAGVTCVLMAPRGANASGSQVAAIKSAGSGRGELVVDELAAIKLSFGGKDPVLGLDALRGPLKKAKEYDDAWKKYYEDLKKWEEEQAKKKAEQEAAAAGAGAATPEAKDAGKKEAKNDAPQPEQKEEVKPDPVSGTWEGTIQGGPLPEPIPVTLKLKLGSDGATVTGSAATPMSPDESAVEGTFQGGKRLVLKVAQETPMGAPVLEAEIDREDHMTGQFKVGDRFSLQFEANRTAKDAPLIKVSGRRAKSKDGRPEPPKIQEGLEPFRKVLSGEVPLLVEANSAPEIDAVIKVAVEEYKVPLVLLGGIEATEVKARIAAAKTGVVAALPLETRRDRKPYFQVVDLSAAGVPVAFQSDAEDGARSLPDMARFAVQNGMESAAALEALTIHAARLFHIDDRVGSLAPGRDADLVVFSGFPFAPSSRVLRVFVNGKEVEP